MGAFRFSFLMFMFVAVADDVADGRWQEFPFANKEFRVERTILLIYL